MNFIDKQYAVRLTLQLCQQCFETFFEVTPVFSASQKCAHIETIDNSIADHIGYFFVDNALSQAFNNGRFTDARVTDKKRIVLTSTRQNLHKTINFELASDQWVDFTLARQAIEVSRIPFKSRLGPCFRFFIEIVCRLISALFRTADFRNAVRDVINHINTSNILLLQEINSLAFLLTEYGDKDIRTGDFSFAR